MKPKLLIFFIILSLLFAWPLFFLTRPCIASDLPETFRITRLRIQGNDQLKKKKILSVLSLLPPSPWQIWRSKPVGSGQDLSEEMERIADLYRQYGFYHAVVSFEVEMDSRDTDAVPVARVVYTVEEGSPVVVEKLHINTENTDTDVDIVELLDVLPLKSGMRFEEKAYRASKKAILKAFGSAGYPFATISGKVLIYPDTNSAVITLSVSSGMLCYFGDTTLVDSSSFVNEKILDRSREYRTGEIYDTSKVDQSQRNLYNLDIFKAAVIEPGVLDPETGEVPLSLSLKPKKKRSVKLGAGYGEEDGVRLKAGYTYRNPLQWAGQLNFETKRTDLLWKASTGYNQPFFLDSNGALQTEAGVLCESLDSYETLQFFTDIKYNRTLSQQLDLTLAYLLGYYELKDLNLIDPDEIAAFRDDNTFMLSSVFTEIIRDTTENETDPESGSILSGAIEIASSFTGSELTYVNPVVEARKYIRLPFRSVLALRLKLEAISDIENDEDLPVFKRLFLGGANSVRGYAYQTLGPLDASGNPEGGQSSLLANVEVRCPLFNLLSGVLFLDGGMISQDRFSFSGDELRWSAGAGLRLGTPVGPIRFDFGYKLNPANRSDLTADNEEETDRWRIHFNIGHAF